MRLLLDQGLPRSTAARLTASGIESLHVAELGLGTATDPVIPAEAVTRQAVIVTLDADFHALLALSGATAPSVIRLRLQGLKAEQATRILVDLVLRFSLDLDLGAVISVTETRIRVRRLPL